MPLVTWHKIVTFLLSAMHVPMFVHTECPRTGISHGMVEIRTGKTQSAWMALTVSVSLITVSAWMALTVSVNLIRSSATLNFYIGLFDQVKIGCCNCSFLAFLLMVWHGGKFISHTRDFNVYGAIVLILILDLSFYSLVRRFVCLLETCVMCLVRRLLISY